MKAAIDEIKEDGGLEKEVLLRADGNVPYQKVVYLMSILSEAEFKNIGMVTEVGAIEE